MLLDRSVFVYNEDGQNIVKIYKKFGVTSFSLIACNNEIAAKHIHAVAVYIVRDIIRRGEEIWNVHDGLLSIRFSKYLCTLHLSFTGNNLTILSLYRLEIAISKWIAKIVGCLDEEFSIEMAECLHNYEETGDMSEHKSGISDEEIIEIGTRC